jgi:hypothetical protein
MFVLRSLAWLTTLVLLLPPAADGEPAPRVSLVHAAYSAKVIIQDVTGVCGRNPEACATSREALALLSAKIETGADIVTAGLAAREALADPAVRGTLTPSDLEMGWSLARGGQ